MSEALLRLLSLIQSQVEEGLISEDVAYDLVRGVGWVVGELEGRLDERLELEQLVKIGKAPALID